MDRAATALTSPRLVLAAMGAAFAIATATTLQYPPDYFTWPLLWALLSCAASAWCFMAAWWPGRRRVAIAGAASIATAASRSVAITATVILRTPDEPAIWSFWLAATTWLLIAILVHSLWAHVVLPWSAMLRSP